MMWLKIIFTSFMFALSGSFSHAEIIFDGRFNKGDFSVYQLETNGASTSGTSIPNGIPGRLERVPDPAGSGKSVALATRLIDDAPTHGGYRSEMSASKDSIGSERWYSWGYYLPGMFENVKNDIVIAQIHDTPDVNENSSRNPTLAVVAQNNKLILVNAFDYDNITSHSDRIPRAGVDYERRELTSWELETGKWVYLDIHARWAADDGGFLKFWKDGVLLFQERNHINTFNDERGVWFKNGVYDFSHNPELVSSYSTGVKIGDEKETFQSMTMSIAPEPNAYLMMLVGLICVGFAACRHDLSSFINQIS